MTRRQSLAWLARTSNDKRPKAPAETASTCADVLTGRNDFAHHRAADGASVWESGLAGVSVAYAALVLMMQGLRPEWLASVAEHFLGLADGTVA